MGMGLLPKLRGHHKGDTVSLPYRMWHHWFMFPTSYFSIININNDPAVRYQEGTQPGQASGPPALFVISLVSLAPFSYGQGS